mmetsp:Transcript_7565/g.31452  ORF Transcript_7565/g.31452 Transcript_7565/m.31452 type:complete len:273 (-) Transcript_7565:1291-2109(-)
MRHSAGARDEGRDARGGAGRPRGAVLPGDVDEPFLRGQKKRAFREVPHGHAPGARVSRVRREPRPPASGRIAAREIPFRRRPLGRRRLGRVAIHLRSKPRRRRRRMAVFARDARDVRRRAIVRHIACSGSRVREFKPPRVQALLRGVLRRAPRGAARDAAPGRSLRARRVENDAALIRRDAFGARGGVRRDDASDVARATLFKDERFASAGQESQSESVLGVLPRGGGDRRGEPARFAGRRGTRETPIVLQRAPRGARFGGATRKAENEEEG